MKQLQRSLFYHSIVTQFMDIAVLVIDITHVELLFFTTQNRYIN